MEKKAYFASIANLRVIAIMAIILNHSQLGIEADTHYSLTYLIYGQFSKFGSLLFMIISGFLFEKTISKYTTEQLLYRKTTTILFPSLLFILPWIILNIGVLPFIGEQTAVISKSFIYTELYNIFFRSIYWFPINLFLILMINSFIRGRRSLSLLLIPAVLITIFYSVNIYYHWVPRRHNSAILAFFTFFFAGRLLHIYYPQVKNIIKNASRNLFLKLLFCGLSITFFVCAVFESYYIQENVQGTDPNNILRMSNILYTIVFLTFLYGIRNRVDFTKYFADKTVFLIYLIHPYYLYVGKFLSGKIIKFGQLHTADYIPLELAYGTVIFILSVFSARLLLKSPVFNSIISGDIWVKRAGIEARQVSG
ncbi:acyltransferase [Desertivirga xinjiangensis]|uniref:acyltransferase n=1 Tax=Desertivirga xinjiangensis TaxID=539206 RepID=UPI00210B8C58|nr:acyltransferase [Pedobacter xinjiangensis]